MVSATLEQLIESVVTNGNCIGCGLCVAQFDCVEGLEPEGSGFLRPVLARDAVGTKEERELFRRVCPGAAVNLRSRGPIRLPGGLGRCVAVWEGYAADPSLRWKGSSGGVLSALQSWLLESGGASVASGAGTRWGDPTRSDVSMSRESGEVYEAAGSRYAPVPSLIHVNLLGDNDALCAKPCEVMAARRLSTTKEGASPPWLLSFFCAGVPSQHGTEELLHGLDIRKESVARLRYRGRGWPGGFAVETVDGDKGYIPYAESWGKTLNQFLHPRCKICPDGVGLAADVVAADYWESDSAGWPLMVDRPGFSLIVARTQRGRLLVESAINNGFLVASTVSLDRLADVQRYQVERRRTYPGRMIGSALGGVKIPNAVSVELFYTFFRAPLANMRAAVGSYRRARLR